MPEHLRHQGLVMWDDSIAKRWAWHEWVEIYSRGMRAVVFVAHDHRILGLESFYLGC